VSHKLLTRNTLLSASTRLDTKHFDAMPFQPYQKQLSRLDNQERQSPSWQLQVTPACAAQLPRSPLLRLVVPLLNAQPALGATRVTAASGAPDRLRV
jgi:hypothetical protein